MKTALKIVGGFLGIVIAVVVLALVYARFHDGPIAILAGGPAGPAARRLELAARVGAEVYGIASTPFLDREFKTVRFEQSLEIGDDTLRYAQDTQLLLKGRSDVFHHRDANVLRRVG